MIFTQYDAERFRNNPRAFMEKVQKSFVQGDTEIVYAREPLFDNYPKEDGIFFIYNKLIAVENYTTDNIANTLLPYIAFMKKHKIQIIKEYDKYCSLAYEGELPNIKVDNFETQSFYGFNKFQIIDYETLSRKEEKNVVFIKGIDFTYGLDSNAASFFEKYCKNNDERYKALYNEIVADENNIDIAPYIFEIIMHGLRDFGINYKLNKNNKNKTQAGFFQNLSVLYNHGLFKAKLEKIFINSIIKNTNRLIEYYGVIGYGARIFLLIMLEAKYKFSDSPNKIKSYVYSELRRVNIPIENRLKAILYLFTEKPGHPFFEKVINVKNIGKLEVYMSNVDNTSRDIALSLLERYIYGRVNIFPFLATDDLAFIKMLKDNKPEYIFKYENIEIPVYKKITQDMQKKHLEFFETGVPSSISYSGGSLKELMQIYNAKKEDFIQLITNKD